MAEESASPITNSTKAVRGRAGAYCETFGKKIKNVLPRDNVLSHQNKVAVL